MNREDIEKKAHCWVDNYPQSDECVYTQDDADRMMRNSFLAGAEWMQEQYEQNRLKFSENLTKEEYDREVAFSEWFYSQGFNRQPTFSDAIEWERKQIQDEIDELTNKVSELTEALDASHIFCEGVKEHYIKKACKWFEDWLCNEEEWMRRSDFVVKNVEELKQAMKGE